MYYQILDTFAIYIMNLPIWEDAIDILCCLILKFQVDEISIFITILRRQASMKKLSTVANQLIYCFFFRVALISKNVGIWLFQRQHEYRQKFHLLCEVQSVKFTANKFPHSHSHAKRFHNQLDFIEHNNRYIWISLHAERIVHRNIKHLVFIFHESVYCTGNVFSILTGDVAFSIGFSWSDFVYG